MRALRDAEDRSEVTRRPGLTDGPLASSSPPLMRAQNCLARRDALVGGARCYLCQNNGSRARGRLGGDCAHDCALRHRRPHRIFPARCDLLSFHWAPPMVSALTAPVSVVHTFVGL